PQVRSTIAAGTVARRETSLAAAAPGVLVVLTHENAGRLRKPKRNLLFPPPAPPLQDPKIRFHGQYVAMVVAETRQQAAASARLVEVTYDPDEPVLTAEDAAAKTRSNPYFVDMKRGNAKAALEAADVTVEGTFTTSPETHNPLGPFTTVAHWGTSTASMGHERPAHKPMRSMLQALDDPAYPLTIGTTAAYACPNVAARDKRVSLNIPSIAHMRAPGEAEGNFALESLLDELSYELGVDPIELRLRNYADVHPQTGLPWSNKALRECYEGGAERFGCAQRDPAVGAMRDGRWLVGYGMGGATFGHYTAK